VRRGPGQSAGAVRFRGPGVASAGVMGEAVAGAVVVAGLNGAAIAGGPAAALDLFPVSAGISGAILAGLQALRPSNPGEGLNREGWYHAVSTVLSGAAAAIFIVPAACGWAGIDEWRTVVFAHLVGGLVGSTLVDQILARRADIVARVLRHWTDNPPATVPPAPAPAECGKLWTPLLIGAPAATVALAGYAPAFWLALGLGLSVSQVSHYCAHYPRSSAVRRLQRLRIWLRPADHGAHHAGRFDLNFCVLSGWNNWWINRVVCWADSRAAR
jgi:hypothetical protein